MDDAIATGVMGKGDTAQNNVREVVGVFDTPAHLEAAVEQLGIAGIDRAAISVPEHHPTNRDHPSDKDARLH